MMTIFRAKRCYVCLVIIVLSFLLSFGDAMTEDELVLFKKEEEMKEREKLIKLRGSMAAEVSNTDEYERNEVFNTDEYERNEYEDSEYEIEYTDEAALDQENHAGEAEYKDGAEYEYEY
eukprot:g2382.t1